MGEKEDRDKHNAALIKSLEQGLEDLANGGMGLPWKSPDREVRDTPKGPEMI